MHHNHIVRSLYLAAALAFTATGRVGALYPYKLIQNAAHEASALTPAEWSSEFRCLDGTVAQQNGSLPLECYRDENFWLYKHMDEILGKFKLLVQQETLDERLADKVYMVDRHTGLNYHHYKFNTGSPARDQALQRYVAGPRVDDKLCKLHLKQMVALLGDFGQRLERKRAGANESDPSARLDERHFRLARVLDSFGRYESGQLGGRYHSFGIYHECFRTALKLGDLSDGDGGGGENEVQDTRQQLVDSRYCWTKLKLDDHVSAPLRGRDVMNMRWGDFGFHMATCLPVSCHSKSFSSDPENLQLVQRLVNSQYEMPDSMYVNQSLPVESVFCLVDSDSKLGRMRPSGILLVVFLLGWCGLCALATFLRRDKHNLLSEESPGEMTTQLQIADAGGGGYVRRKRPGFWSHLDLNDSVYEFVGRNDRRRVGLVNLDTLNFIKCVCTLFVNIAHACLLASPMSYAQLEMQALMETGRLEAFAMFGFVLVDTFFVISGLVVTYISLRKFTRVETTQRQRALANQMLPATVTSKRQVVVDFEREYSPMGATFYKSWFLMTYGRYLRLVPLFFLAFWFKKGLFLWLGEGPLWDHGLNRDTQIGGCQQETWLTPFTTLAAYLPAPRQCVPQGWSIANDLAMALFIPPLTVLLFKRPRMGYLYAFLVYALSVYFGVSTYYGLDARLRFMLEEMRNYSVVILFQVASFAYAAPCYRVPSIVAGVLAGYVLFHWEQRCKQEPGGKCAHSWPWWFRWLATPLASTFILYTLSSSYFAAEMRRSASDTARHVHIPLYMLSVHHTLWSLANAVIFLRMVSDWSQNFTMRLFASRFFKVASKLSYAFLLIHWDILLYDNLIEPQAGDFSRWYYFKSLGTGYIYSIPVSMAVHIVLEHPMDKLTKAYLMPRT